jgi:hypothetical protein
VRDHFGRSASRTHVEGAAIAGPGAWATVMRGLFNLPKIATLLAAPFFWVRSIGRATLKAGPANGRGASTSCDRESGPE